MAGVNKVILIGNLGQDPETRTTEPGVSVTTLSIATSETYKDRNTGEKKELTEWHRVVLWRGLADVAAKYLSKGSRIYVEGKLQTRSYEGSDGIKRYTTEVVGREMVMLSGGQTSSNRPPLPSSQDEPMPAQRPWDKPGHVTDVAPVSAEEDDLPF
jgi:single-strand DNA-binding protein